MKLDFKRRELELNLYGELIKMSFPTVNEFRVYEKKLNAESDKSELDIMSEFLVDLGLPEKMIMSMEPEHFKSLLETLTGSKKK